MEIYDFNSVIVPPIPMWKRCVDLFFSSIALIFLLPVFLVIGVLIKLTSPGPVFFRQKRIGYRNKEFTIYKFRTMFVNADEKTHINYVKQLMKNDLDDDISSPMKKLPNDKRITPLGHLLRMTYVDELPQLFNVIKGEMSLVGPRPDLVELVYNYKQWNLARHDTLPGMTGLWQICGKNDLSFKDMVRLDIKYSRIKSVWVDIKIIFLTPIKIITRKITD